MMLMLMMIKDIVRRKMLLPRTAWLGQTWMCWALVPLRICVLGVPRFTVPETQRSSSHPSLSRPLWRSSINSAHDSCGCSRAKCFSCHWVAPVPVQLLEALRCWSRSPRLAIKGLRWLSLLHLQPMIRLQVVLVSYRSECRFQSVAKYCLHRFSSIHCSCQWKLFAATWAHINILQVLCVCGWRGV